MKLIFNLPSTEQSSEATVEQPIDSKKIKRGKKLI